MKTRTCLYNQVSGYWAISHDDRYKTNSLPYENSLRHATGKWMAMWVCNSRHNHTEVVFCHNVELITYNIINLILWFNIEYYILEFS